MGLILTFLGVVALAILTRVLTDEFKAWTPWVIEWLIRIAVSKLDDDLRSRMAEEWHSHIAETPGDLGKLITAGGFIFAAHKFRGEVVTPVWARLFGAAGFVLFAPL